MTPFPLPALDGRILSARRYAPESPSAALVVLGALGVPQGYYAAFAEHLARRGVAVLTFDYRGSGESADRPAASDPATLLEWGQLDAGAALDAVRLAWPTVPRWGLGHSFGGQAFGLTGRSLELDGLVIVAAGSGDLRRYPPALRWRHRVQLGAIPVAARIFGYVPGWLGVGADLPAGVLTQWASWCAHPDYVRGALPPELLRYGELTQPLVHVAMSDDTYAPPAASDELLSWFGRAQVERRHLSRPGIGHFGWFRRGMEAEWDALADRVLPQATVNRPDLAA